MYRREVPPALPGSRSLKRDPALVELSRDHHAALVHALELRRARTAPVEEAVRCARAFLDFVEAELAGHFADEEVVLLPVAESLNPQEAERVRAEHRELERLTSGLRERLRSAAPTGPLCGEIGELLHDHVRFEERTFFEGLQRALGAEALEGLGRALAARRVERGRGPGCALS
jgi:hemerythrin-like domain-containing protein